MADKRPWWMLRHVVGPDATQPRTWPYDQAHVVFTSRDLPTISNADIRFVRGDVRPVHREMVAAATGCNVWLVGGGELVGIGSLIGRTRAAVPSRDV